MSNPYETLGVKPSASQDEIKAAYRKLAKKFHPDLNPGNKGAEARFKDLSLAFELVGDPEARAKFDRGEAEAEAAQHAREEFDPRAFQSGRYEQRFHQDFNMDDELLKNLFSQFQSKREEPSYAVELGFEEALLGTEKEMAFPDGKKLRVKFPAGLGNGQKIRVGDRVIEARIKPSTLFREIDGSDLEVNVDVPLSTAVLGGEARVQTPEGPVMAKVPEMSSSGRRLRLKGRGAGKPGARGDLYGILRIQLPEKLDETVKRALRDSQTESRAS